MKWLARFFERDKLASRNSLDEVKNQAYLAYAKWGPEGVQHRDSQLADVFPNVPAETRRLWIAEFSQVNREIGNVVGRFGEGDRLRFEAHIRAKFPFLNRQALEHAWSLFSYYSIHG